jgi:polysaccharide biosynthesis transport protein
MSLGQIIAILRARWWVAVLVLLVTLAVAYVVLKNRPKVYTAAAVMVVDTKPDPVSAMMYGGMASPLFMATQIEVIQSDRVAARVVRNLKLADNPQVREQWMEATKGRGNIEAWLGETFQKSMSVKPSPQSSVLTLTYQALDPQFAAALANAFVQAYLETNLELRVDPAKQYSTFFDSRAKEARERLEAAQAKLSSYQKEKGIVATDERLDVENARLAELSSQLVTLQALSSESGSRQAAAQGASGDRVQEVLNNNIVSGLRSELLRNETALQQLNERLGDNHPQVLDAKTNITSLRAKIETETRRVTSSVGVSANINRQRVAEVRSALEAQRSKMLTMKGQRDESSVLVRDVETAQRAYDAVVARFNQSSLESQATLSNVNVLTPATPPLEPSTPPALKLAVAALLGGIGLGIAAAIGLELLDRRVRTKEDASSAMGGLPMLGVMPKPKARLSQGKKQALLAQRRVVGQLAPPSGAR